MASSVIGALRVNLGIDSAAFTAGLQQATGKLSSFGTMARRAILPVAAVMTAAATGMAVAVKSTIDAAEEMSKAAQKFGVPIDQLSRLKYAADLSGVSLQGLGTSFGILSNNMIKAAEGNKAAAKSFTDVGINIRNADGSIKSANEVLAALSDIMATMPDGAEKTALAMELMGKSGKEMIPLLNAGAEALGAMRDEAEKFGQIFSEDTGRAAAQFNDNLSRLKGAFEKVTAELTKDVLPTLVKFTDWLVQNSPAVSHFVSDVIDGFARLATDIGPVIQSVIGAYGDVKDAVNKIIAASDRFRNSVVDSINSVIPATDALRAAVEWLTRTFTTNSNTALAWAANLDAASQRVAQSTVANIATAISKIEELKRAQGSITPLEGDSPFTIAPGFNRLENEIEGQEKYSHILRKQLITLRERALITKSEVDSTKSLTEFTTRVSAAISASVPPATKVATFINDAAGGSGGGGGGGAAKLADELERAKDVLFEQQGAYKDILLRLAGVAEGSEFVADEARALNEALEDSGVSAEAFLKTVGLTHNEYTDMLRDTERLTDELEKQEGIAESIGDAFTAFGKGILQISSSTGGLKDSLGGIAESITETLQGPFIDEMSKVFKTLGDRLAKSLQNLSAGGGGRGLLSPAAISGVGSGLGMAAAGALQGSTQAIGSGIGQAAGAAIGSVFGPIGTVLGGIAGGFIGSLFGGGEESKWKRPEGTAFTGTTYSSSVMGSREVNIESPDNAGKFAFQGTKNLLENFNKELAQFVENIGGTINKGVKLVVNQQAALKKITGTLSDRTANRPGESEDEAAARIADRVNQIMGLAAALVQKSGPALTQAQNLWREAQERFSAGNIAILKDLGFAAKRIKELQEQIKGDIVQAFEREVLQGLVDTGRATKKEIGKWLNVELEALAERRKQAVQTAKEIGASVKIVEAAFRAERKDVKEAYRELLGGLVKETKDTASGLLAKLMDKMGSLESKRAKVLGELARRSDEAADAEQTLLDARRSLKASSLAPGGPMDLFGTLQRQFANAIKDARGGDADAAGRAAGLASDLLESGRGVFASGTQYADLFRQVNKDLLEAQRGFDARGDKLKKQLDASSMNEITERSTKALLTALGRLSEDIRDVKAEIKDQKREQRLDQQRKNAGRGA